MEHKRGGAWYNRNKAWFLRLKPYREGKIRAPNGVRAHIQEKTENTHSPTSIIVYEASEEKVISSS